MSQIGYRPSGLGRSFLVLLALLATSCQTDSKSQVIGSSGVSQAALRSVQTRAFETTDRDLIFRGIISTLQDLGFVIDKVDADLGTVSATKLSGYQVRMTVTARLLGMTRVAVRASAQYNTEAMSEASPYQQFFSALEKAVFLASNDID